MLDEDKNWAIDVPGLRENLQEARKHCDPRIMVVINPGNPTGKKIRRTLYDVQGKYTLVSLLLAGTKFSDFQNS